MAIIRWEGGFQKEGRTNLQVARVMMVTNTTSGCDRSEAHI